MKYLGLYYLILFGDHVHQVQLEYREIEKQLVLFAMHHAVMQFHYTFFHLEYTKKFICIFILKDSKKEKRWLKEDPVSFLYHIILFYAHSYKAHKCIWVQM